MFHGPVFGLVTLSDSLPDDSEYIIRLRDPALGFRL